MLVDEERGPRETDRGYAGQSGSEREAVDAGASGDQLVFRCCVFKALTAESGDGVEAPSHDRRSA